MRTTDKGRHIYMSTTSPLVSIVIPVYNGSNYMREAIDSALAQTYKNIEIIVVNDGSTDNGETERIALSYGDKITYYKKENGGCASALNYGISKMNGQWFSWLSHDDVYFPDKVRSTVEQMKKLDDPENTIICCGSMSINANGNEVISRKSATAPTLRTPQQQLHIFMGGAALNGCALLIPRQALHSVGAFRTDYTYILDWLYWVELSLQKYSFYFFPDVLVKNRKHRQQVSVQKHDLLDTERRKFALEMIARYESSPEILQQLWLYCKRLGIKDGLAQIEHLIAIPGSIRSLGFKRHVIFRAVSFARKILKV